MPSLADIVTTDDGVFLIVGGASGADIVYGHPVGASDPTALVELRELGAVRITPAGDASRGLVEALRRGVAPSALPAIHAAVVAIAAEDA
ncbi:MULTISPECIES: hypothetical protein [Microbacterium]|uniref:Uncharacterized protein n=1 Tax=Microbacterium hominis TaxID=162426 RepID=A0A2K9DQJ2_9MICO|nr:MULTISPECIES: hypothetical protein [Microbacterium]AUG29496.1 hypothetical protein CXR34_08595 [Microbacterium hominis]EPD84193.1 hypothetical protein HMPREF1529_02258 [Microbacterium sp. oral taxon 186 str. F0373]